LKYGFLSLEVSCLTLLPLVVARIGKVGDASPVVFSLEKTAP